MKIFSRVNDKIVYLALVLSVFLCFISSCSIWIYSFYEHQDYWKEIAKCVPARDFTCLIREVAIEESSFALIQQTIAFILSFVALILSCTIVALYKFKFRDTDA